MGVALTSCTVPAAGKPTFDARRGRDGDGRRHPRRAGPPARASSQSADAIAEEMVGAIPGDLGARRGRRGAAARQRLRRHAADGALPDVRRGPARARAAGPARSRRSLVGNYVTSLDMAGCSLTVTLLDDELRAVGRAGTYGGAAVVGDERPTLATAGRAWTFERPAEGGGSPQRVQARPDRAITGCTGRPGGSSRRRTSRGAGSPAVSGLPAQTSYREAGDERYRVRVAAAVVRRPSRRGVGAPERGQDRDPRQSGLVALGRYRRD